MVRLLKKITLSCVSILGISLLFWSIMFMCPSLSYAHSTEFDNITVYHNNPVDPAIGTVLSDAVSTIKKSTLFDEDIHISLCMNDDKFFKNIHPLNGSPLAYALFDKTVIHSCTLNFSENLATTKWERNNFEFRKFDLTYLLAHEFTHNLQIKADPIYWLKSTIDIRGFKINWKFEGHADYIARQYQHDGRLREKITTYLAEEQKEHNGFPVFELEDGTKQILSYFKFSLVIQYLMEEKKMSFTQICETEMDFERQFQEMVDWSNQ